jgi:phage-related protein
VYYIAEDAVVILDAFSKKTSSTPKAVITACQRRLRAFQQLVPERKSTQHEKE